MLSAEMEKAFNDQMNREYYSSYLYLSMAAWFEHQNLKGFANWMKVQSQEELFHVDRIFKFIHDRGGKVRLIGIKDPETEWKDPLACFQFGLDHEKEVSQEINKLVDLAIKSSDHASNNFLQWFVAEQVEEEASTDEVLQRLKLIKGDPGALFMIDRELAKRQAALDGGPDGAAN